MDTRRLILFAIFIFSVLQLWAAWQKQEAALHAPPPQAQTQGTVPGKGAVPTNPGAVPGSSLPASGAVPASPNAAPMAATPATAASGGALTEAVVKTDLVTAKISSRGGDLVALSFTQHKDAEDKNKDFELLGTHNYIAQTGLRSDQVDLPSHLTLFTLAPGTYELKPGESELKLRMEAAAGAVKVAKIYTFHRGSYLIDVSYEVNNGGTAPISPWAYLQLVRDNKGSPNESRFMHTYTGPAYYTNKDHFEKADFSDIEKGKAPRPEPAQDGWVAMVQHYFVSAWLPQGEVRREFYSEKLGGDLYATGVKGLSLGTVAPGATATFTAKLFAGPQETAALEAAAPHLERVKDYGWLDIIARYMYQLLVWLHGHLGNWGLAIIALTVIIKAIFFPLSAASYKSMARMKKVTPKMTALREKYANDRMKMNQAMMELYKTEKINPLGGCFPVLIQVPVFISLYYALLSAVELRHAPFYGWLTDLSAPDTLFGTILGMPLGILPLLMAVTMFLQTKMNPAPPDPVQAKMMTIMPLVFSFLFFFFPAGLVLYYVVNNVLSIAQQYSITRLIDGGGDAKGGDSKGGKPVAANDASAKKK